MSRPRDMNPNIPRQVTATTPLHVYTTLPRYMTFPHHMTLPQHMSLPHNIILPHNITVPHNMTFPYYMALPSSLRPLTPTGDLEPCRIQEVYLFIDRRSHPGSIDASLLSTLPADVQLLAITSTRESVQCDSYYYPRDLPTVFGGDTPNLRALVLDAHAPFLPGNAFPNLVNLRVSCLPHMIVGFRLLLQLFSNTPRLETLELLLHPRRPRGVDERVEVTDGTRGLDTWTTPVSLSRLRVLTISGLYVQVAMTMLSKLDVPPRVVMRLLKLQLDLDTATPIPTLMVPALRNISGLTHLDIFECIQDKDEDKYEDEDDKEIQAEKEQYRLLLERSARVPQMRGLALANLPQGRKVEHARPAGPLSSCYLIRHGLHSGLWIHVEAPLRLREYVQSGVLQSLQPELPLGDITTLRMSVLPNRLSCLSSMVSRMSSLTTLTLRSIQRLSSEQAGAALQEISRALTPLSPGTSAAAIPAPNLEAVSIEVLSDFVLPTSLVNMAERRVISAVPLVSVTCSIPDAPPLELQRLSDHVIDDVDVTRRSLRWDSAEVLTPVWRTTNEYWGMHPQLADKDAWGLPETLS
ncbi:hypothetical protein C8T65DRAFT_97862 [Cerioporus squamosus]|nr:hypothetical protein C8T65DRAFT_97862 [Cerioporus squamosus]